MKRGSIACLGLALGLLLAGCATQAQVAERNQQRCVNRGYQPGTTDFEKCMQLVDNERQERLDNRRQEWMLKSGNPFRQ